MKAEIGSMPKVSGKRIVMAAEGPEARQHADDRCRKACRESRQRRLEGVSRDLESMSEGGDDVHRL